MCCCFDTAFVFEAHRLIASLVNITSVLQGWTRNYHGSVWTDHRDGAMFGDPE